MRRLHTFSWGLAALSAIPPLFPALGIHSSLSYGNTQGTGWCWIDTTDEREFDAGTAWRFFAFYVPLWLAVCYNIRVYASIYHRFRALLQDAADDRSIRDSGRGRARAALTRIRRLQRYPLIMILAWTCGTVNRIHTSAFPRSPLLWLYCLHAATSSLMGFMNATVYGANPQVQAAWQQEYEHGALCARLKGVLPHRKLNDEEAGAAEDADAGSSDGRSSPPAGLQLERAADKAGSITV